MYKMNLALYASILPAESSMHRAYRVTMAAPAHLCAVVRMVMFIMLVFLALSEL
jgi:hypothetical protein